MKTLSIKQPWAALVCAGIKDVENRNWAPEELPGKILIYASSEPVDEYIESEIDEFNYELSNIRMKGWIPEYAEMPLDAIIGYVTVEKICKDSTSFWSDPSCFNWCLKDAYLFDEPILNPGKDAATKEEGLWDYPLDEGNLPSAHKADLPQARREGTHLFIPASKTVLEWVESGEKEFIYRLTETNLNLLCTDNDIDPQETKTVTFFGFGKEITCEVSELFTSPFYYENGDPIFITNRNGTTGFFAYAMIVLA